MREREHKDPTTPTTQNEAARVIVDRFHEMNQRLNQMSSAMTSLRERMNTMAELAGRVNAAFMVMVGMPRAMRSDLFHLVAGGHPGGGGGGSGSTSRSKGSSASGISGNYLQEYQQYVELRRKERQEALQHILMTGELRKQEREKSDQEYQNRRRQQDEEKARRRQAEDEYWAKVRQQRQQDRAETFKYYEDLAKVKETFGSKFAYKKSGAFSGKAAESSVHPMVAAFRSDKEIAFNLAQVKANRGDRNALEKLHSSLIGFASSNVDSLAEDTFANLKRGFDNLGLLFNNLNQNSPDPKEVAKYLKAVKFLQQAFDEVQAPVGGTPTPTPSTSPTAASSAVASTGPQQAATFDKSKYPSWIVDDIQSTMNVIPTNIQEQIADLAAQYKTAKEIADILGISKENVKNVRLALGIPPVTEQVAGIAMASGGPAIISPEFTKWRDARLAAKQTSGISAAAPSAAASTGLQGVATAAQQATTALSDLASSAGLPPPGGPGGVGQKPPGSPQYWADLSGIPPWKRQALKQRRFQENLEAMAGFEQGTPAVPNPQVSRSTRIKNTFKNFLDDIQDPQRRTNLEQFKVANKNFAESIKGLSKFSQITQKIARKFYGDPEAGPLGRGVKDRWHETTSKFSSKVSHTAVGVFGAAAGIVSSGAPDAWATLTGSIKLLAGSIAELLIPSTLRLSALFQEWADSLSGMSSESKDNLATAIKWGVGLGVGTLAFNKFAAVVTGVSSGLTSLGVALAPLPLALTALGASAVALTATWLRDAPDKTAKETEDRYNAMVQKAPADNPFAALDYAAPEYRQQILDMVDKKQYREAATKVSRAAQFNAWEAKEQGHLAGHAQSVFDPVKRFVGVTPAADERTADSDKLWARSKKLYDLSGYLFNLARSKEGQDPKGVVLGGGVMATLAYPRRHAGQEAEELKEKAQRKTDPEKKSGLALALVTKATPQYSSLEEAYKNIQLDILDKDPLGIKNLTTQIQNLVKTLEEGARLGAAGDQKVADALQGVVDPNIKININQGPAVKMVP